VTYRLSDHTTADDASRYRSADEVAAAWQREPIGRLRNYLLSVQAWSKRDEEALLKEVAERVQEAAQSYLEHAPPPPAQMFDHLHAALPAAWSAQRSEAIARERTDAAGHAG
jgi:pyruvate dehydrogenase E1 component alpha subunit